MQSSIKNQTGEYTVLGNEEALKSGTLQATDLPVIRIWKDSNGKLWILDHRRLAAFRIAELDSVPFRWATDEEVASQMWKMTTKTQGTSIKLKLGNGESMIIQQRGDKMNFNRRIKDINSKEEFMKFLMELQQDKEQKSDEWENADITSYLEAIRSWVNDMDGYFENMNITMPTNINWKFIATLFYVGKIYE